MMATWHGTLQGYNGQALADKKHQVIVQRSLFRQALELLQLAFFLCAANVTVENLH